MITSLAKFIIKRTDLLEDDLQIESSSITIGSDLGNDIVLNHPSVSRIHAGICKIDNDYWLKNLCSSNGTIVNGALIDTILLDSIDIIQIGVFLLKPMIDDEEDSLILEVEKQIDCLSATERITKLITTNFTVRDCKCCSLNPEMLKMLGIQLPEAKPSVKPLMGSARLQQRKVDDLTLL